MRRRPYIVGDSMYPLLKSGDIVLTNNWATSTTSSGRYVSAVDRHRRRGVRDGEIHSEIRPRGVCETREPEPAPRRQGRGNQPHKGNRAGQGQHQG